MKPGRSLSASLVATVLVPGTLAASALTLTVDNDKFTGSDNNFSNGTALTWSSDELGQYRDDALARRWTRLWDFLPLLGDGRHRHWASWSFGQEMHTPNDITDPNPPLDDQPYAGVLYLDSGFHARGKRWSHTWNLRLGVVGPASLADSTQRAFHNLIGADQPRGWSTQLPNEPLLNFDYTGGFAWHERALGEDLGWRLVPNFSAGLGNYFTGVSLGLYSEIGWNLGTTLSVPTLRQGFSTAPTIGEAPLEQWTVSLFAGGAAYGIAHYLPLDGTVFRNSRSVDSNPLVGLFTAGITLRRKRFSLMLSATYFTETFATERANTEFGTISLAWFL